MKLARYFLIFVAACCLVAAPQQKKKAGSTGTTQTPATKTSAAEKTSGKTQLLDINSASEQELKQLPGIGDAYAAKIVQNRPYRAKNQLIQKKIIPAATYDKIKDQIIAKQGSTPAKK